MPRNPGTRGAHRPVKPFRFNVPKKPQIFPAAFSEEDGDWWGGVNKCFASIAIAATLSVLPAPSTLTLQNQNEEIVPQTPFALSSGGFSVLAQQGATEIRYQFYDDDIVPQPSVFGLDEDFSQPFIQQVQLPPPKVFTDDDVPAGALYGQPDEDYWINPVAPVQATLVWPQQWIFNDEIIPPIPFALSSGGFSLLTQQGNTELRYHFDDEVLPSAAFQPDEDLWQNPVQPAQYILGRLYLPDTDDVPAGSLYGQPDEDFWVNPVAPVLLTLRWPNPWQFEQNEQAFGLYGQFDEDFWTPQIPPQLWFVPPRALSDDEIIVPQPQFINTDEDFWQNPVVPVQATLGKLYLPDPEELPAATLYGQPDEDLWAPQISSQAFQVPPRVFTDDEIIVPQPSTISTDEDFWQNQVAPAQWIFGKIYLPDPEEIPAATLYGQPDEDFWINPVAPVKATLGPLYLPDPEELPAGSLYVQPEEDFWVNPVAPVQAALGRIYLPDPEEIPAGLLHGQFDEDFWNNPILPVWSYPVPLVFRDDDVVVQQAVPFYTDEDFWINPVAPVWYRNLPIYLPDPEELLIVIPFIPGIAFNRVELGWGGDMAGDNVTLGGFG